MKNWWQQYVAVSIAILLLGGIGLRLASSYFLGDSDESALAGLEEIKDAVRLALDDKTAWKQTVRRNGDRFSCLRHSGIACRGKGAQFTIYAADAQKNIPLTQLNDELGITRSLTSCANFPSVACPYHVQATWRPVGDDTSCDGRRPVNVVSRVVLNTGSLYHEWKFEKDLIAEVKLTPKARCECEGKEFTGNQCLGMNNLADAERAGRAPASDEADRDVEEVDERGMEDKTADAAVAPECASQVEFRGELYVVLGVNALGQAEISLPGEDSRCAAADTYRFQCVAKKLASGQSAGEWILTGITRGECSEGAPAIVDPNASTLDTSNMEPPQLAPGEREDESYPRADGAADPNLSVPTEVLPEEPIEE